MGCTLLPINLGAAWQSEAKSNRLELESRTPLDFDRIVQEPGNSVMYYLKDAPERAFVCEELMLDT